MGCGPSTLSGTEIASGKSPVIAKNNIKVIGSPVKLSQNQQTPTSLDDLHLVALTSSSYGFLKLDQQDEDSMPDQQRDTSKADKTSVQEVLTKFEDKEDSGPKSWLEVSNMLQNLKPDEKNKKKKKGQGIETVDVNEIMKDIDEDTGLPGRPKLNPLKNGRKYSKGLSYHTVEEIDKAMGLGKGVKDVADNVAKDYKDFLKDNKIKFGAKSSRNGRQGKDQYGNDKDGGLMLNLDANDGKNGLKKIFGVNNGSQTANFDVEFLGNEYGAVKEGDSTNHLDVNSSKMDVNQVFDAKNESKSVLFDVDFLGSYQKSLMELNESDWNVISVNERLHLHEENNVDQIERIGESDIMSSKLRTAEQDPEQPQSDSKGVNKRLQYDRAKSSPILSKNTLVQAHMVNTEKLEGFDKLCPPRGEGLVVLYTTSLRRIKKTYEDCIKVKEILQSFSVEYIDERDVSKHLEYRNELMDLFQRVVTVPRLFIHGRYIGGAEDVSKLHGEGKLVELFE